MAMAIVITIASVLIIVILEFAIRIMLFAGVFAIFFSWLWLIVIAILSSGVGPIYLPCSTNCLALTTQALSGLGRLQRG